LSVLLTFTPRALFTTSAASLKIFDRVVMQLVQPTV
jgi:hypothetical protein